MPVGEQVPGRTAIALYVSRDTLELFGNMIPHLGAPAASTVVRAFQKSKFPPGAVAINITVIRLCTFHRQSGFYPLVS